MGKIEKIEKLAGKGKAEKVLKFVGDKDKEVRLAVIAGALAGAALKRRRKF